MPGADVADDLLGLPFEVPRRRRGGGGGELGVAVDDFGAFVVAQVLGQLGDDVDVLGGDGSGGERVVERGQCRAGPVAFLGGFRVACGTGGASRIVSNPPRSRSCSFNALARRAQRIA